MAETQTTQPLPNYVRMHRRKAGLTQRELGLILGYGYDSPVSRHERFNSVPPLTVAIGYEIVFRTPISEIFAGVYEGVNTGIQERLASLEKGLAQPKDKAKEDGVRTMKLEFLRERQKVKMGEREASVRNGSTGNASGRSARST
jgi:DNA-binding XRE family transcriptional regulator